MLSNIANYIGGDIDVLIGTFDLDSDSFRSDMINIYDIYAKSVNIIRDNVIALIGARVDDNNYLYL